MAVERGAGTLSARVTTWLARSPRWLRASVGLIAVALGVVLLTRPTTSLGVLALLLGVGLVWSGFVELLDRFDGDDVTPPGRSQAARAVVWIAAGLAALLWPGLTVRVLAAVVGIGLIVNGVLSILSGIRRRTTIDGRIAAVAMGVAEVVFGVFALSWPDITLLVVAIAFGARLIMAGVVETWHAARGPRETSHVARGPRALTSPGDGARTPASPGADPRAAASPGAAASRTPRRWGRAFVALVALMLAGGAAALSAAIHDGSPVVDAFYAPPRDVPDEPGQLIRSETFTRDVPEDALGWRILYTTTRGDGSPAVASGLVVVPRDGEGPWPVIHWAHGTTGYAENCAPSLATKPFESGAFFLLDQVVANGWALVAADYIGLGTQGPHPYLIGVDTAHAVLDAARASRQLSGTQLGAQNVVWGHSQGGGAALWTGALADQYAPELDIDGVAALAPAGNLPGLVDSLPTITGGSVFAAYVFEAYAANYDDVRARDYVRPGAQVTVEEMAKRCLAEPGVLVSVLNALALSRDPEIFSQDPTGGPLGQRLEQNVPPATISAPLLVGQGGADQLVVPAAQDAYVDQLCADGQQMDYRVYASLDHVALVEPDSPLVPELIAWTQDRLTGQPVASGCTRADR